MRGALSGKPSASLPVYPTEDWCCDGCGQTVQISLTPNALRKGAFKHLTCGGSYKPEPGREEST